jgi:hypothetical protein
MAGIEVTTLHKQYPDGTVAVDQLDLEAPSGQITVLGPIDDRRVHVAQPAADRSPQRRARRASAA